MGHLSPCELTRFVTKQVHESHSEKSDANNAMSTPSPKSHRAIIVKITPSNAVNSISMHCSDQSFWMSFSFQCEGEVSKSTQHDSLHLVFNMVRYYFLQQPHPAQILTSCPKCSEGTMLYYVVIFIHVLLVTWIGS